jgi:hypothetical protein
LLCGGSQLRLVDDGLLLDCESRGGSASLTGERQGIVLCDDDGDDPDAVGSLADGCTPANREAAGCETIGRGTDSVTVVGDGRAGCCVTTCCGPLVD